VRVFSSLGKWCGLLNIHIFLSSFLTSFQAFMCTSSASPWPGVASAPPRAQPKAKAHGVKQSKSLVVTQYAEPLLPTSGENQNR
jgi:hypothetical protein